MNRVARFIVAAGIVGFGISPFSPAVLSFPAYADLATPDLVALAKQARPAVMLLIIYDARGKEIATGTGFLVSADGLLITNHHVIADADHVVAKAENGGLFPMKEVLADDPKNDLAVLKIAGKGLSFLTLANGPVEPGTRIAVIGSPEGMEATLSDGIVSAVRELGLDQKVIQMTAPISHGSSGSPVLRADGKVIGVVSSCLREGQSINFAVPVEYAERLIEEARKEKTQRDQAKLQASSETEVYAEEDWRTASALWASGNLEGTIQSLKSLAKKHPDNFLAHFYLGLASLEAKRFEAGLKASKIAAKLNPKCAEAWNNIGAALVCLRRLSEVIEPCEKALKLRPDDPMALTNVGLGYADAWRFEDGLKACQRATQLDPTLPVCWGNLAVVFGGMKRYDEAISACEKALSIDPGYAPAWYGVGWSYHCKGQHEKAAEALGQLEKLDSGLAAELKSYIDKK